MATKKVPSEKNLRQRAQATVHELVEAAGQTAQGFVHVVESLLPLPSARKTTRKSPAKRAAGKKSIATRGKNEVTKGARKAAKAVKKAAPSPRKKPAASSRPKAGKK